MFDVNLEWVERVREFLDEIRPVYDEVDRLLTRNRIFIDRTKGIGVLSREDAINLGATGPIARASGVVRDLRKDEPYLAYPDFDFKVVCSHGGDCYARYLVRMGEMLESLKIIDQAIENLAGGSGQRGGGNRRGVAGEAARVPEHRGVDSALRSGDAEPRLRRAGGRDVRGDGIAERRAGLLHCGGTATTRAYRARTRPPSYIHFAMFPHMIRGHQLSDVVAVLGSINIIAAELDR